MRIKVDFEYKPSRDFYEAIEWRIAEYLVSEKKKIVENLVEDEIDKIKQNLKKDVRNKFLEYLDEDEK